MSFIGRGATGTVYKLNDCIAEKRARVGVEEEADHANEQRIFTFLENHPPIPYLIQCYYQIPRETFLELAPLGSIAMVLNQYQKRHHLHGAQILEISQLLGSQEINR